MMIKVNLDILKTIESSILHYRNGYDEEYFIASNYYYIKVTDPIKYNRNLRLNDILGESDDELEHLNMFLPVLLKYKDHILVTSFQPAISFSYRNI